MISHSRREESNLLSVVESKTLAAILIYLSYQLWFPEGRLCCSVSVYPSQKLETGRTDLNVRERRERGEEEAKQEE